MQGSKLYVGNLNYSTTEEQLAELFGNYGQVESVKIIESRGFGFVEMSSSEEAEQAQEALNETEFHGRTLRIDEARPPKRRDSGGYGHSSRRGSRDRGRKGQQRGGRGGRGNSGYNDYY